MSKISNEIKYCHTINMDNERKPKTISRKIRLRVYNAFKNKGGVFKDTPFKTYLSTGAHEYFEKFNKRTKTKTKTKRTGSYNKRHLLWKQAKSVGYEGSYVKSTINELNKFLNVKMGLKVTVEYVKFSIPEKEEPSFPVDFVFKNRKVKTFLISSTQISKENDVNQLVKKFGDTVMASVQLNPVIDYKNESYGIVKQVSIEESVIIPSYTFMTVPMKDRSSPKLITFDTQGKTIADYVNNHNDRCVIDYIHEFYMKPYGYHKVNNPNGRIRYLDKTGISDLISKLYNKPDTLKTCTCLLPLMCDCSDTVYNAYVDGVSVQQLSLFCINYNITLRVCDIDNIQMYSFVGSNKIKPMMVISHNGHIYPIVNNQLRTHLAQSGRYVQKKRDSNNKIIDNCSKETTQQNYLPIKSSCDLLELSNEYDNTVFIVKDDIITEKFLDLLVLRNEYYSHKFKANHMVELYLPNKNVVCYNEDCSSVIKACEIMNIPFTNQSLLQLTHEKLNDKQILKDLSSSFSDNILTTIKSDMPCGNWVRKYENSYDFVNVKAFDFNKLYSSIFENKDTLWFKTDITSQVSLYDKKALTSDKLYYVNTSVNDMLLQGSGWYFYEIVDIALKDNLIEKHCITHEINGFVQNTDVFTKFVSDIYNTFPVDIAKSMLNPFIGNLGKTHKSIGKTSYTTSIEQAFCETKADENYIFSQTHLGKEVFRSSNVALQELDNINILMNRKIVQLGWLAVYKLIKTLGGTLLAVKTDCVIVDSPINVNTSDTRGGYKIEKISEKSLRNFMTRQHNHTVRDVATFDLNLKDIVKVDIKDEYDTEAIVNTILDNDNVLLLGRAGTGKSQIIKKMIKKLKLREIKHKVAVPTNQAGRVISDEAKTLHKLFGYDIEGKIHSVNLSGNQYIIIDEISMIQTEFWAEIIKIRRKHPLIKFLLCGDFNQLPPVGQENIDIYNSAFFRDIVDCKIELKINKRLKGDGVKHFDIMTSAINGDQINHKFESNSDDIKKHLCFTNFKRICINKQMMLRERGDEYLTIDPPKSNKTIVPLYQQIHLYKDLKLVCKKNLKKFKLFNGDSLTVISFTDKSVKLLCDYNQEEIDISIDTDFCLTFYPGYARTVHSSQGQTFDTPYCLHETQKYSNEMLYVALSRTKQLCFIHVD